MRTLPLSWSPRPALWCSASALTSRTSRRSVSVRATRSSSTPSSTDSSKWAIGANTRSNTVASSPCAVRSSTSTLRRRTGPSASTCGATRSSGSPRSRWTTREATTTSTMWRCSRAGSSWPRPRSASGRRPSSTPSPGERRRGDASPTVSCSTAWSPGFRGWSTSPGREPPTSCSTSWAPMPR